MNKHPKYTAEHYKYDLPVGTTITAQKLIKYEVTKVEQDVWIVVASDVIEIGSKVTIGTFREIKLVGSEL